MLTYEIYLLIFFIDEKRKCQKQESSIYEMSKKLHQNEKKKKIACKHTAKSLKKKSHAFVQLNEFFSVLPRPI